MLVGIIVEEGWASTACIFEVPYGRRPDLTKAWNPLQIPIINHTGDKAINSCTHFSLRRILTINLAEPSGSSAAEKPPAKKRMLALPMLSTIVSTDLTIASSLSVTNGTKLTSAPSFSNALAESYSELVPGKTGI